MKNILLFGAGKSATVLIDYLIKTVNENNWNFTVADNNELLLKEKVTISNNISIVVLNIEDKDARQQLIAKADVVISMMPPHLHYLIAQDCLEHNKHLLTASYVDEKIKEHATSIQEKGLLFLCEMGLDPGIDHMSAMHLIHNIQEKGGKITSFKSHCGGLVAPENDDNPWHYKISWNPRNVVLAGKAGAIFKNNHQITHLPYEELFNKNESITTSTNNVYAFYPNRDSLSYIDVYELQEAETFVRTTLRHPNFCTGWKNIIALKLTDETPAYDTTNMSIAHFFQTHFKKHHTEQWLSSLINKQVNNTDNIVNTILEWVNTDEKNKHEKLLANTVLEQLLFLGLNDNETLINKGFCSAADVLQYILEKKLALHNTDKDLIVMLHEIDYIQNDKKYCISSLLELVGEDNHKTAMAKTVGLPLGIAAKLILENKIQVRGLHIPIIAEIYTPVLAELQKHGIQFKETAKSID
ncbi:MAG: saccharopine dehydrogenase NADP-binding domain-containing protein [Chitinophagaceae bacterium]|nr:saccharopine dehydrogenase NADP-binding domain-containing protein [Chitinophagaceae bacterium]MCW5905846.1 saccharopine dehydrogenase NADP-binding domain-containing protein [Chitinophagaceae bacterium]